MRSITSTACLSRLQQIATILFLGTFVSTGPAQSATTIPENPHTLSTVRQVHELNALEAAKALPVHLRAEVTYFDPVNDKRHAAMFIHDQTGGIYVLVPNRSSWPDGVPVPGSIVDITGVSAPGDYASIVDQPQIKVVGKSHDPLTAKRVTLGQLLTGEEDSQWVEVEGVVQSVAETRTKVVLDVAMQDGMISAISVKDSDSVYSHLRGSKVLLRGNAAALFNHDRQLTGFRLMFPGLGAVSVEEAGPEDPFSLPIRSINDLSRFRPSANLLRMVHLRGNVTFQWPGTMVCIQDETQALCAHTSASLALKKGQLIDLVGFASLGGYRPTVYYAEIKPGSDGSMPVPAAISVADALRGNEDAKLVELEGRLVGYDLAAKDKTLLLSSGNVLFPVILATAPPADRLAALKIDSMVRIKGICAVDLDTQGTSRGDGAAVITTFRILAQSLDEVSIVQTPSWWTPVHSLSAFGISAAIALAVLGWVAVLRRRVDQQTRMLRESEERFRHMAQHDALTGLPTRMLLHDRLQMALERGRRFGTNLAVLMIDLDNFKHVNDSYGHDAGDLTLRRTAERILSATRKSDTAARMGGDEFIVLLTDIADDQEAEAIAGKIRTSLAEPIRLADQEVPVSASIGVCVVSRGAMDAAMLLKKVDLAMYHAKARGRNCFEVFTGDLTTATLSVLTLQASLAHALERQELELHYQPMISFETGKVTGFEALVRWNSREHGRVMPSDFIPIAEESGLIVPIGEWIIREAGRQIAELERQCGETFQLAVNISPRQLLDPRIVPMIENALFLSRRPRGCLTLEITESTLLSDTRSTQDTLMSLRNLGVQLAIDDFGIGFSSLSYITRFPVDWIKIDRSLICDCATVPGSLAVLRAIVAMAHALDIRLVAEGVETKEQFDLLKSEQCNVVQGYYFSRPLPFIDLPAFLATSQIYLDSDQAARMHSLAEPSLSEGFSSTQAVHKARPLLQAVMGRLASILQGSRWSKPPAGTNVPGDAPHTSRITVIGEACHGKSRRRGVTRDRWPHGARQQPVQTLFHPRRPAHKTRHSPLFPGCRSGRAARHRGSSGRPQAFRQWCRGRAVLPEARTQ